MRRRDFFKRIAGVVGISAIAGDGIAKALQDTKIGFDPSSGQDVEVRVSYQGQVFVGDLTTFGNNFQQSAPIGESIEYSIDGVPVTAAEYRQRLLERDMRVGWRKYRTVNEARHAMGLKPLGTGDNLI